MDVDKKWERNVKAKPKNNNQKLIPHIQNKNSTLVADIRRSCNTIQERYEFEEEDRGNVSSRIIRAKSSYQVYRTNYQRPQSNRPNTTNFMFRPVRNAGGKSLDLNSRGMGMRGINIGVYRKCCYF